MVRLDRHIANSHFNCRPLSVYDYMPELEGLCTQMRELLRVYWRLARAIEDDMLEETR